MSCRSVQGARSFIRDPVGVARATCSREAPSVVAGTARRGAPEADRTVRTFRTATLAIIAMLLQSAVVADDGARRLVEKGKYLAAAGNCISCHTGAGSEPFAGGVEFETPFGMLYSTNITPDRGSGIGGWTLEDFTRALREGVRPDGEHLYPAFPYTAFTKVTDQDVAALFAYLKSVPPVAASPQANRLRFPFSQRWSVKAWKALYFEPGSYVHDQRQSELWNRGAYLVQGLGHCSMCHSPRTLLAGEDSDRAMSGGTYRDNVAGRVLDWSASNLTSARDGLQSWSVSDIVSYLKFGCSARAGVFGPMNDVVVNSTRHLSEEDLGAIALYLKSLPAVSQLEPVASTAAAQSGDGELQYDIHCGTCHLSDGRGSDTTGPPLAGSAIVQAVDPASLVNITLYGAQLPATPPSEQWRLRKWQAMEAFGEKLSDEAAAALLTYVRAAWGNRAEAVNAADVAKQR